MATVLRLGRPVYTGAQVFNPRITKIVTETNSSAAVDSFTAKAGEILEVTAVDSAVLVNVNAATASTAFKVCVASGGVNYIPELSDGDTFTIVTIAVA